MPPLPGWTIAAIALSRRPASDIIDLLIETLKGIGIADNKRLQAHTKADHHNPSNPDAA